MQMKNFGYVCPSGYPLARFCMLVVLIGSWRTKSFEHQSSIRSIQT